MKALLSLFALCIAGLISNAQTTLFFENFDSANVKFTLNTTDVSSTTSGLNSWTINNVYQGGQGSFICLGSPFTYSVLSTAAQPAGITNNPQSKYLHTTNDTAIADNILCSSYGAADGLCIMADNIFTRMTNDVNTTGYSTVNFNFWWVCGGGSFWYGEVYYSTNGGTSWVQVTNPIQQFKNTTIWTQQSLTDPAWAGQSTLRFGFRFVNGSSLFGGATDPGFSIDDVSIVGQVAPTITTGSVNGSFCPGDSLWVPFTTSGTFNSGNVFTCQLSDNTGSFTSPTTIGTLTGTTAGTVSCYIPGGTPTGVAYRVRIVASNPTTTGTDNGNNLTINPPSVGGTAIPNPATVCTNGSTQIALSFQSGTITYWLTSTDSITWSTYTPAGANAAFNFTPTQTNTWFMAVVLKNPCEPDSSDPAKVVLADAAVAGTLSGQDTVCIGQATTLTNAGSTGSIQWQNSIDGINFVNVPAATNPTLTTSSLLQDTWYRVVVTSASCGNDTTAGMMIKVQPSPTALFSALASGLTATFTDQSTGATSWSWNFGDGSSSTNQNPTHLYSSIGTYLVTLIVSNGGCNDTVTDSVMVGSVAIGKSLISPFEVSPNPSTGIVTVKFEQDITGKVAFTLLDLSGKEVWREDRVLGSNKTLRLDLQNVAAGTYFIRIKADQNIRLEKLVIRD